MKLPTTNLNARSHERIGPLGLRYAFVFLACIAILLSLGCGESAKWRHAQAKNLYSDGDLAGAIEVLEKAYQQSPENDTIKFDLARYYSENGECHLGLGLCDDHIAEHPQDSSGFHYRSECLMFFGKFKRALVDYKKSISGHISRSPRELNNLAYNRGLANVEIDSAARDIQEAIREIELRVGWGAGPQLMGRGRLSLQVRTLVTTGLVSRHIDRHEEALHFLDRTINRYEANLKRNTERLKNRVTAEVRVSFPFPKKLEEELAEVRAQMEFQKLSIAAMLVTRTLVQEDLGESGKADSDRVRVDELGFDFESLVDDLPSDFSCLYFGRDQSSLELATTFLDTRGFVLGRQRWVGDQSQWPESISETPVGSDAESGGDSDRQAASADADEKTSNLKFDPSNPLMVSSYEMALEDLNLAVLASQFNLLAMESPLFNTPDLTVQSVERRKLQASKTTAVLFHHRKEVHLRAGNKAAAAKDQLQIDALGFKDSSLY